MDLPRTPSFRLEGKRALITGAGSGIGMGCAVALAGAGAHVVCAARSPGPINALVAALRDKGLNAEGLGLDISDCGGTARTLSAIAPFDILLNSAGTARHSALVDTTIADFDAVAAVNWRGAHFLCQAVAKDMIAAGIKGSIINISSQMAHVGGIDRSVYAASKHAVEGMTKSMAIELGPHGIRANTICPTFVRTPLTEQTFSQPDRVKWIEQKIKLGRIGEIEDVMGPAVFLASAASALITGASLLVDGGWTAG